MKDTVFNTAIMLLESDRFDRAESLLYGAFFQDPSGFTKEEWGVFWMISDMNQDLVLLSA